MRAYVEAGTVELPGGLVREGAPPVTSVELRPLSGWEEEWLSCNSGAPPALAVSALLDACVTECGGGPCPKGMAAQLLAGDRDYLMLQLRRMTFGDRIRAVINCPACEAKMDTDFLAGDVPVERRPQTQPTYSVDAGGGSIHFRLPNGADQEFVSHMSTASAVEALLERCLLRDSFQSVALANSERDAVIAAMEANAPRVDLDLELLCPECGQESVVPFDTTSFFIREMTSRRPYLLKEVHSLAWHYHWSEADIMSMTRSRRRAYLELLSEASRPS
jgi:hypothetical protein